jgi:hypothetical protein
MNGKTRLIAAPRSKLHRLGGEYKTTGDGLEEEGGDIEISSLPEYCSESEGMVTDDSVKALDRSLEDMFGVWVLQQKYRRLVNLPEGRWEIGTWRTARGWRSSIVSANLRTGLMYALKT